MRYPVQRGQIFALTFTLEVIELELCPIDDYLNSYEFATLFRIYELAIGTLSCSTNKGVAKTLSIRL